MRLTELFQPISEDEYTNEIKSYLIDQLLSLKEKNVKQVPINRIQQILNDNGYDVDREFVDGLLGNLKNVGQINNDEFVLDPEFSKKMKDEKKKKQKDRKTVKSMASKTINRELKGNK